MPVPPIAIKWMSREGLRGRSVERKVGAGYHSPRGALPRCRRRATLIPLLDDHPLDAARPRRPEPARETIAMTTRRRLPTWAPLAPLLFASVLFGPPQAGAQPPQRSAPRAVAPEPLWDAGSVGRGAKVSHDFVLRNEGDAVLHVREVQPACGCTVVRFDSTIPPGGEGVVTTEVDTETFRGPIAKDVTVLTSDPANPAIVLTVRADVQPVVDAVPGYFRFVHVQGAAAPQSVQVVWSNDRPDFALTAVESPLPAVSVAFRPAAEGERDPDGKGRQWLVSATADFGSFSPAEPRRGSVLLTNHGEAPVRVLAVESDVPGVSAQVAEREKGKKFDLNLTVAAGIARGPIAGTLRVRTDSPRHPLLEIPLKGRVQ
jgi:hypothetical protein